MRLHELTDTKRMCDNLQIVLARCLDQVNEKKVFDISWCKSKRKYKIVFCTNSGRKFSKYYTSKEILNPVTIMLSGMLRKAKGHSPIKEKSMSEYYFHQNLSDVNISDDELPF